MDRIKVVSKMQEQGMVPLFFHSDVEVCKKVVKACYDGGARLLEFTNRGVFAHEIFAELSKYCRKELPGMYLGIGSITDAASASIYMLNGAAFVVTPALRKDIAISCNRRKIAFMPGCGSLTEIGEAEELGCEVVKLFPGSTYGPNFIKSIRGPQPWTMVMPTGGVSPEEDNLRGWFSAGAICVGMGSKLLSKDLIDNENYLEITKKVKDTLALIQTIRS
jgi:2-dehydro-3-deoxyphosphogluconate aldolase/(4S)-4-hydroxy-2-oxoglutarate aldolase